MPPKRKPASPVKKPAAPAKKPSAAGAKKKGPKSLYDKPEPMPAGTIITDLQKNQWLIGNSIGVGGFGEIYSACNASKAPKKFEDYPYVIKIVSALK